jgi:hypothetical protein
VTSPSRDERAGQHRTPKREVGRADPAPAVGSQAGACRPHGEVVPGTSLGPVTLTEENDAITAQRLRDGLVDRLVVEDVIPPGQIEAAMRAVPRHAFVPGVALTEAYADDIVRTK